MSWKYLFLIMIILLGFFLRLHQLDTENIWVDEAFALKHAQQKTISGVIDSVKSIEGAPPGHFLLLHYWIKWFGNSAFSVRFPSVIFGVLSIILMFWLGCLLFDKKIALLSSFFLSTSMLQVLYSQEARLYSLFTFLTLLSACFFIKWYQSSNLKYYSLYFFLYLFSIVMAIYTNYLTFILILFYTLYLLFENIKWNLWKKWFFVHIIILLFSLPLLTLILFQFKIINTGLSLSLINKGLPHFLAQLGIFFYVLPPFLTLVLILVYFLEKKKIIPKIPLQNYPLFFSIILFLWGLFYLFLTLKPFSLFGITIFRQPITHSYFLIRHSLFFAPIVYLALASTIMNLKSKNVYLFCISFIILVNTLALTVYFHNPTKAQWKEAVDFITEQDSEPLILLDKGGESHRFLVQYYDPKKQQINLISLTSSADRLEGRKVKKISSKDLFELIENYDSFWLILSRNNDDDYKIILDSKYKLDQTQEFYQVKVYHYTTKNTLMTDSLTTFSNPLILYSPLFSNNNND